MKVISSLATALQKVVVIRFFFIWFKVRFFNFATSKANCDWLALILNMSHFNQNKTTNTIIGSTLRSHQVHSINTTHGILDIFQILDTENKSVMQIIPCLAILSKKVKVILPTLSKKTHNFMRKTNYLKKTQMILSSYIQISQRKGKKKGLLGMWMFLSKSRYHSIYFRKWKLFQF